MGPDRVLWPKQGHAIPPEAGDCYSCWAGRLQRLPGHRWPSLSAGPAQKPELCHRNSQLRSQHNPGMTLSPARTAGVNTGKMHFLIPGRESRGGKEGFNCTAMKGRKGLSARPWLTVPAGPRPNGLQGSLGAGKSSRSCSQSLSELSHN